ncbi:hypothetical protein RNAN_3433 [Rheinheimera nanhaiensis E407-8]|uniref:Uncharacterized protein n=1 Tax=Rheinheimera nanhaiensis E407-8 TaxID=562729 RepID=I1E281_9GAMM|nr:hypothetical protein RNAN_3433 [Rheinheimera nanhaiensis E407-8]
MSWPFCAKQKTSFSVPQCACDSRRFVNIYCFSDKKAGLMPAWFG